MALTQEMENCIPDTYRDSASDARELGRILDAFLRTLTPDNQMVFLRRYWYVDTIAEIAARYGISESAVQMRLNRTKQKLSAYLARRAFAYERKGYFRGLQYIGDDLIENAETGQFPAQNQESGKTHRPIRRPLLIAALIALLLLLVGCAVVYVLKLENVKSERERNSGTILW